MPCFSRKYTEGAGYLALGLDLNPPPMHSLQLELQLLLLVLLLTEFVCHWRNPEKDFSSHETLAKRPQEGDDGADRRGAVRASGAGR